jgi:hypothetical protein
MRALFSLGLFLISTLACFAQSGVAYGFSYDASGNRIQRFITVVDDPNNPNNNRVNPFINGNEVQNDSAIVAENNVLDIVVYPNPTDREVTIEIKNFELAENLTQYTLTDINGKLCLKGAIHEGRTNLNLSGVERGTYFLRVIANGRDYGYQIIKTN